jgi:hypothetical protein
MPIRPPNVFTPISRLCSSQEPPQQRIRHWLSPRRPQNVTYPLLASSSSKRTPPNKLTPSPPSIITPATTAFSERPTRLKARDDSSGIRWNELLEKFRITQERARRASRPNNRGGLDSGDNRYDAPSSVGSDKDDRRYVSAGPGTAVASTVLLDHRPGQVMTQGGGGAVPGHHLRPGSGLAGQVGRGGGATPQQPVSGREKFGRGLGLGRFASAGKKVKK